MKKISFSYRGKKVSLNCRECGFFSFGLMFRSRKTAPCVFEFDAPTDFKISSLFVPFPFIAVWIGDDGRVMEKRIVKPFTLSVKSKKPYYTLVEIPLNKINSKIIDSLVDD